MAKGALIVPVDGPVGTGLVTRLLAGGYAVTAGHTDGASSLEAHAGDKRLVTERWVPQSFISSRNLVLAALNRPDPLDTAIIVVEYPSPADSPEEITPTGLEQWVDLTWKGTMLIIREVLVAFSRRKAGRLAFVLYTPDSRATGILGTTSAASHGALGEALVERYRSDLLAVDSFESSREDPEGFADAIHSTLLRDPERKAYRYTGRGFGKPGLRGR
jgi:hypothetical protein